MISLWIYMQRLGIRRLVRMRSENEGKMLYIGDTDFASTALTVVYKNRMRRVIKNRMHNWLTYTSISDSSPENFRAFHSPHFRLPLKERSASRTEFSKTSLAANSIDRQKYVGVCNCKYTWKTLPSFSVFTIPALAALIWSWWILAKGHRNQGDFSVTNIHYTTRKIDWNLFSKEW